MTDSRIIPDTPADGRAGTTDTGGDPRATRDDSPLGAAGQRALEREREARRAAEREARELRERVRELELETARREVAVELGLTPEQAALLRGANSEELRDHGRQLVEAFAPGGRRPPGTLRPGSVPGVQPGRSAAELAEEILRGR